MKIEKVESCEMAMLASSNVQATLDMIVKSLAEEDDATLTPMKTLKRAMCSERQLEGLQH